jgi:hypothetical protein
VKSLPKPALPPARPAIPKKSEIKSPDIAKFRAPGINQSGPLWGFFDIPPTPTQIEPANLDAVALGEALADLDSQ